MQEYVEERIIYNIDNKEYVVIERSKKEKNSNEIYNILSKYALQKLQNLK